MYPSVFISEAVSIGDQIISEAKEDSNGIFWEVHQPVGDTVVSKSIYNGNAGILLFLIEIYKKTEKITYYNAIISGCNWLINCNYDNSNLCYYSGDGGVIHVLSEAYLITNETRYIDAIKKIAKINILNINYVRSDLLVGLSGHILSLLHLYNIINEPWVIEGIELSIHSLINRIVITKHGFCWDRIGDSVFPLCGFSHGASGVAYIFLKLYEFFKNESFLWIAKNAFMYEDAFFNKQLNNWPDFRKDLESENGINKLIIAYKEHNDAEFDRRYMSAWCHGAPGIGIARLLAYRITNDKKYYRSFYDCLENINNKLNYYDYTLCHGVFGNFSLFIDGYVYFNDLDLFRKAIQWGETGLALKKQLGYYVSGLPTVNKPADCSLFLGLAGIGLFYLRLSDPSNINSALSPNISSKKKNCYFENITINSVANILYRKLFVNASSLHSNIFDSNDTFTESEYFRETVLKKINALYPNCDVYLKNSIIIDIDKLNINDAIPNDVYLNIELQVISKNAEERVMNINSSTNITVNKKVSIHNFNIDESSYNIILMPYFRDQGTKEYRIGGFQFDILKSFENPCNILTAFNVICKKYAHIDEEQLYGLFIKQVKNCIYHLFLIIEQ